jgi:opacity protein-like surface antigen
MRVLAAFLGVTVASVLAPSARAEQAAIGVGGDVSADGEDPQVTAADDGGRTHAESGDEPRPESGFQNALRVGISLPAGVTSEGHALSDDVVRRVPVIGDLGYRIDRHWFLGIMGMVGLDEATNDCGLGEGAADVNCTLEGWRLGLEAFAHPLGNDSLDLWLGGGIGWEHLETKVLIPPPAGATTAGTTLRSSEEGPALDLAAGIDFPIEGKLAAGPFLGYTGGMFLQRSTVCPANASCPSNEIGDTGLHHWFTLGARGRFGP